MPVLPDFDPQNAAYGRSAGAYINAADEGQSMMARAQQMQQRQQQADQLKAEFIAKLPAIQANATLAQVNAKAAVDNEVHNAAFEAKAGAESVQANKEYQDAITYNAANDIPAPSELPDDATPDEIAAHNEEVATQAELGKNATQATYEGRVQRLSALKAKYAYMANLKEPGYKAFYDNIDKSLAQSNENLHVNLKLEELLNAANARADAMKYGADTRYAGTVYGADARTTQTGMKDETSLANTKTIADAKVAAAKARGEKTYEFEATLEKRNQAIRDNDKEAAALYQARLNKMVTTPNSTADSVLPLPSSIPPPKPQVAPQTSEAPTGVSISIPGSGLPPSNQGVSTVRAEPVAPTAVAPTKVDPKATEVDIGGKKYPIFKDKNGKRAYKIDGHFVRIDTQ